VYLQGPNGLLGDAEQGSGTGQDEDEESEEGVNGQVSGAKVRGKAGKEEGDQSRKPLKKKVSRLSEMYVNLNGGDVKVDKQC